VMGGEQCGDKTKKKKKRGTIEAVDRNQGATPNTGRGSHVTREKKAQRQLRRSRGEGPSYQERIDYPGRQRKKKKNNLAPEESYHTRGGGGGGGGGKKLILIVQESRNLSVPPNN